MAISVTSYKIWPEEILRFLQCVCGNFEQVSVKGSLILTQV